MAIDARQRNRQANLFLDEGFPKRTIALSKGDIKILRADTSARSDEVLVLQAAEEGCHGVVFLGAEVLARDELLRVAKEARVTLIAEAQEDLESGSEYSLRHLATLRQVIGGVDAVTIWLAE